MTRDLIIPGSIRTEHVEYNWVKITFRCGRCGHEQEARAECRTSRCKNCGRTCHLEEPARLRAAE